MTGELEIAVIPGMDLQVVQEASQRVLDTIEAGIPENTRKAYRSGAKDWESWCRDGAIDSQSLTPQNVVMYLQGLMDKGRKPATIDSRLAALSALAGTLGQPNPRGHPIIRAWLRGMKRMNTSRVKEAAPFPLLDLLQGLPKGLGMADVRDRALLLVGFAGALRSSELTSLQWDGIERVQEGVILHFHVTKTELDAQVAIPFGRREDRCPVKALEALRAAQGNPDTGSVFRPLDRAHKSLGAHLGRAAVSPVVRAAAIRAGLDPALYSSHSLRAGLATEASQAGLSDRVIMKHTRHKSIEVFWKYVRVHSLFSENPVKSLL